MDKLVTKLCADSRSKEIASCGVVGGKGRSLLALAKECAVPAGFIVTAPAFDVFVAQCGIGKQIGREKLSAAEIKDVMRRCSSQPLPNKVLAALKKAMEGSGLAGQPAVVRSSATIEDSEGASFAGRFKTIINVTGIEETEKAVREVYASTYTGNVAAYCESVGRALDSVKMAVIVQELINGSVSGVMFTKDPNTWENNTIIEAVVGLNEGQVSGRISPSRFTYDNESGKITSSSYVKQEYAISTKSSSGTAMVLNKTDIKSVLTKGALLLLGATSVRIERLFEAPQDIEWTMKDGKLYILQSRPITSHRSFYLQNAEISGDADKFAGRTASRGVAAGPARVVTSPESKIPSGSVLVVDVLDTEYSAEDIRGVKAIVTEDGGILSHAAIVARELMIPCVVGVKSITRKIKDGQQLVVNGSAGLVYKAGAGGMTLERRTGLDYSFIFDFDMMSRAKGTDIYVEDFGNMLIYYAEKELEPNEARSKLQTEFPGRMIEYGSRPKHFIYLDYLRNMRDKRMKRDTVEAVGAARSLSAEKVDGVSKELLAEARSYLEKFRELENDGSRSGKLLALQNLLRAGWCYTLVNELICEGYGITALDGRLRSLLEPHGISILDFMSSIDENQKLTVAGLSHEEEEALGSTVSFYTKIKEWRTASYPMFKDIGATGKQYYSVRDELIATLSAPGKTREEVVEEALAISNTESYLRS